MTSEAQKRATARYRKAHVKQIIVRFYPKDEPLYWHIKENGGSAYLKELAEKDMR